MAEATEDAQFAEDFQIPSRNLPRISFSVNLVIHVKYSFLDRAKI
jgi:hypothetical protein